MQRGPVDEHEVGARPVKGLPTLKLPYVSLAKRVNEKIEKEALHDFEEDKAREVLELKVGGKAD